MSGGVANDGRVVVIGSSLAGLRTIEALRREGFGGEIVAVGAEPEMPYDRPPLSKQYLVGDWDDEKISLMRPQHAELDVDWRLGVRANSLDADAHEVRFGSGDALAYDRLVIATGTVPRQLPFGRELSGLHVLRSAADARGLRGDLETARRVVVVGAGFIGMEVAASCCQRGLDVTVVEPLPTPLVRGLGETLGRFVARHHEERGVNLRCGTGVVGFKGTERVEGVELADGSVVAADVVVVGIGVIPATDWLADTSLDLENGILCDAKGMTNVADVAAVGDVSRWSSPRHDVARRMEHWTNAVEQADVLARRLVHGDAATEPFAPIPYVWTDQFGLRIAIAGEVMEGADMHVCHGTLEEGRCLVLFGRDGRLEGAVGFRRPRPLLAMRRRMAEDITWDEAVAENS